MKEERPCMSSGEHRYALFPASDTMIQCGHDKTSWFTLPLTHTPWYTSAAAKGLALPVSRHSHSPKWLLLGVLPQHRGKNNQHTLFVTSFLLKTQEGESLLGPPPLSPNKILIPTGILSSLQIS